MFHRSSGILMHITSLPSPYGIGDLGPAAYRFADFLSKAGQSWWQILPTNQVGEDSNYSPYSGLSAFAGNILLISPESLQKRGYLERNEIEKPSSVSDFREAEKYKRSLLEIAFMRWEEQGGIHQNEFISFCSLNAHWLEDYALYTALRETYGKSWLSWPDKYKKHDRAALEEAKEKSARTILKEKFQQYLFFEQWEALKAYCRINQIRFFGDMPIYVDHQSCDVWSHQDIFKLDAEGNMLSVAGVPPDYFSEDGQLWNMPIYKWETQKGRGFDWWVKRIRHNLSVYDIVRLDHFRGFVDFWEVPYGEETARNGKWSRGPRESLFDKLKAEFPDMPIIAEDLGEIDQPVYDLMESYDLPGMRVLQFAWDDNPGKNPHIVHQHLKNQIAYTGTHDNIPVKAWFSKLDDASREKLAAYIGQPVSSENIHKHFLRLVWESVANISITTTQDLLGLGEEGIMNIPGKAEGNWTWRLKDGALSDEFAADLRSLTWISGRLADQD
ncbi:4-alpha-glucanotransferase [Roseivirga sp. BDSF3-8]|uniref:4-alpha-glucanotransferase n=1 Tax=Roseivirga sp. BDSF3-8 TaxID=3241598 RepID=UPI0035322F66